MSDRMTEELNKLIEMKQAGHLTDEEFAAGKAKLIGGEASSESEPSAEKVRYLVPEPKKKRKLIPILILGWLLLVLLGELALLAEDSSTTSSSRKEPILSAQQVEKVKELCERGQPLGGPVSKDELRKRLPPQRYDGYDSDYWTFKYYPRGSNTASRVNIIFSKGYCSQVDD